MDMRLAILMIGLFTSFSLWAEPRITHDVIIDLLEKEKQFLQARDATSISNLFTDDTVLVMPDGKRLNKNEYMLETVRMFMNTEAILRKHELIQEEISENGLSAEIQVKSVDRYLFVRGSQKKAVTSVSTWNATIVMEDGVAKYKHGEIIHLD
jgi:hypothetical protein